MKPGTFIMMTACCCASWGCGSGTFVDEEIAPPQAPPQQPQVMQFETKTDTVKTTGGIDPARPSQLSQAPQIRFMVQIGAFKDPHYASMVQAATRQRYHLPVLNDFHTRKKLYQIRIGFFETHDQAARFRETLKRDYPADYKDSWIVPLKR